MLKMLVYFMAIWNILLPFGIFSDHLVMYFNRFGILHQGLSGNPVLKPLCVVLSRNLASINKIVWIPKRNLLPTTLLEIKFIYYSDEQSTVYGNMLQSISWALKYLIYKRLFNHIIAMDGLVATYPPLEHEILASNPARV
jgi:hypothetical protein